MSYILCIVFFLTHIDLSEKDVKKLENKLSFRNHIHGLGLLKNMIANDASVLAKMLVTVVTNNNVFAAIKENVPAFDIANLAQFVIRYIRRIQNLSIESSQIKPYSPDTLLYSLSYLICPKQ